MLKRDEMIELLKDIWSSGGETEDMMEKLKRIQDDYDEREGMLRKYGETYDGENREKKEDAEDRREERREDGEPEVDYRSKYQEMRKRYIERFFSSVPEAIEDQDNDIEKDDRSTQMTYDDLFKEKEGD